MASEISLRASKLGYRYQCSDGQHGGLERGGDDSYTLREDGGWASMYAAVLKGRDHNEQVHRGTAEFDIWSWPVAKAV